MTRLLGAPWASVHGPDEPRRLATWTLELGFGGIAPGPAPRPIDWRALLGAAADLPFDFGDAWRLCRSGQAVGRPDAGLAASREARVQEAQAAVRGAVEQAVRLGLRRIVFEPGFVALPGDDADLDLTDPRAAWSEDRVAALRAHRRVGLDAALDRACRSLYRICRAWPDHEFCLALSASAAGLGEPEALAAIYEDLAGCRLAYWHDAAVAGCRADRLGEPQGEALERFAARLVGLTVADWGAGELNLPPGAGVVDFPLVGSYLRSRSDPPTVVVELDPAVPPGEIPGVHSFLMKSGL